MSSEDRSRQGDMHRSSLGVASVLCVAAICTAGTSSMHGGLHGL
eukprot:CAMPEP_0183565476 /NCGR_PEP_ID=MMETSP0371-20130417/108889_1 /TAXON_ID=268820 /ORGANISM="Peridinium aciculiferum, Strain PAER-2" /LENGTH=43 /DNA_ID= /DNA_START= /DNA_END= /DNA_ORIENTATION=